MSKKPVSLVSVSVSVSSFKQAAYQSAVSSEALSTIAQWVYEQCPTFLDEVPTDADAQLAEGWALRWQEKHPAVEYSTEWVPKADGGNVATLAFAMSYTQQEFGRMKADSPVKHGIVGALRKTFQAYKHNRMADLKREVKRLVDADKPRTRVQAADYSKWIADTLDTMKSRRKTAEARGDNTVPDAAKLQQAIDAFNAKLA